MSDFNLSSSVLVNIDITIWTGTAKLDAADTPKAAKDLPPKDIYTGGAIKIYDTSDLKKFRNFKTAAETTAASVGCRLLNAWLVDEKYLDELQVKLSDIYDKWRDAVSAFVKNYPDAADAWARACYPWDDVVRRKQPSDYEIRNRFRFGWQTFRLTPETGGASLGNETDAMVRDIPDKALQSVIDSLNELYNDSFNKPGAVSHKAYAALRRLARRAEALGFANPQVARLAPVLMDMGANKNDALARLVLSRMSDPQGVSDILSIEANGGVETLLLEPTGATPDPDPLITEAGALLNPAPPLNSMDVLDNLGLF